MAVTALGSGLDAGYDDSLGLYAAQTVTPFPVSGLLLSGCSAAKEANAAGPGTSPSRGDVAKTAARRALKLSGSRVGLVSGLDAARSRRRTAF